MLKSAIGKTAHDGWIYHSICVGDTASRIAKALNLDAEKAKTLGYIHDIGKLKGFHNHVIDGYQLSKDKGYDPEYYNICMTHSYLNNDITCTAGKGPNPKNNPFLDEFIKNHIYTLEEKIINLCDLMCTNVNMTLEKRLIDIMVRRGVYNNTVYHIQEAQKLKKEIDDMLGMNVYHLFPDVIDN